MSGDVHIELTPMIDVVFLLLTFFVFTIVLMVRADVLDVNLPELSSGKPADQVVPITIAITESGGLLINREPVTLDQVVERVEAIRAQVGEGALVLAVDTRAQAGVMIALADTLTGAGLGEFSIIGHKPNQTGESSSAQPGSSDTDTPPTDQPTDQPTNQSTQPPTATP